MSDAFAVAGHRALAMVQLPAEHAHTAWEALPLELVQRGTRYDSECPAVKLKAKVVYSARHRTLHLGPVARTPTAPDTRRVNTRDPCRSDLQVGNKAWK